MAYEDGHNADTQNRDLDLPTEEEIEAWHSDEDFDSDGEEDPVASDADKADADLDPDPEEEVSWDDEINPDEGAPFSAPAPVSGEQLIPYRELKPWAHHPAFASRLRGASFVALCASANDPANLPPITVIQTDDGWKVMDGRLRWHAIGVVHGEDSDIGVRCVIFSGTEEEAVQAVADAAVGVAPRSPIEMARAILNLQRVAGISQKAITERFPVLKKDQVSRMTIAARAVERFPTVFDLLAEPDRVAIDLCVKLWQFMKAASEEERAEVLEAAEARISEGAELKPSELFDALGIELDGGTKAKTSALPDPSDVLETIPILGFDDQPVGAIEKLDERVMRFQLPDPASMSIDQREIAAQAYIAQILEYFGLKGGN